MIIMNGSCNRNQDDHNNNPHHSRLKTTIKAIEIRCNKNKQYVVGISELNLWDGDGEREREEYRNTK